MRIQIQRALVLTILAGAAAPSSWAIEPGQVIPPFELPELTGAGYVSSAALLTGHQFLFLVFWESSCPHCVEALLGCEEFHREFAGGDISVVGVNGDSDQILRARGLLEANGITFEQLWDRGGELQDACGVPLETFSIFLVDGGGTVLAKRLDPQGEVSAVMQEMLIGGAEAAMSLETATDAAAPAAGGPGEEGRGLAGLPGFSYGGNVRVRFQGIKTVGDHATGPYGEPVESRNSLLYRFDLEMRQRIGGHVTVGGLLRIGNEGERVLASGPDYLGRAWGSAFAEASWNRFTFRMGYYPLYMTPFTLMRWDWDDNPRIGGDAGCGCGAAAGVLLIESLEELGPTLTFEGVSAEFRSSSHEARLFYVIPRRPKEVGYREVLRLGRDPAEYSLEIYGLDWAWQRYDGRTGSFWRAGLHFTGSWENDESLDLEELEYPAGFTWHESYLLSITGEVPLVRFATVRGEWIAYNEATEHLPMAIDGSDRTDYRGGGGLAGIVFHGGARSYLKIDYLRLDPEFYTPFAALSYEPNWKGPRLSTLWELPRVDLPVLRSLTGEGRDITLFYKRLQEVEVEEEGAERAESSFFGASFDFETRGGFGGSIGWLDRGAWRTGGIEEYDITREALSLLARYRFHQNSYLEATYTRVENREIRWGETRESSTDIYSLYFIGIF